VTKKICPPKESYWPTIASLSIATPAPRHMILMAMMEFESFCDYVKTNIFSGTGMQKAVSLHTDDKVQQVITIVLCFLPHTREELGVRFGFF